ncbi:hypothetical protein ACOI1C_06515 [Bacillus sp. DJP31]|uniref:hypothetical protein n=1 Tax=Bacillus sp. DJP31 TaxID=3409789 RepID=UPI003BB51F49
MDQILKAIQQLEQKFDSKFDKVTTQLDRMETTINNIAQTANEDTVAILKKIDKNTKNINRDIEFLSEQSGKHEMYLNRLSKN